ncbi:DUF4395 domain-containing protein [Actinomadura citrea]|uniref:DUF4395 domain-containing protein n=1 Tax=Actinomadura citrea TaxID=46158 RepID=UPI002E2C4CA2|nr:DUF4395 domain-containing protein [Actinomadura citrea]
MQVDPRGPRFGASVTTAVLVVVLVTGSWALLAAQAVVFAIATFLGLRYAPYGLVFKVLIRPRLAPPRELEDEAPPRFAQGVGFGFALLGTVGYATGTAWLGIGATALALAAAFLNAAFGFCLGCEMYPLFRRITAKVRSEGKVPA